MKKTKTTETTTEGHEAEPTEQAVAEQAQDERPEPKPLAEPVVDDGKATPLEWAQRLGHTDPTKPIRGIGNYKAWIFETARHHAGWGARIAFDVRLTKDEYETAVSAACGVAMTGQ